MSRQPNQRLDTICRRLAPENGLSPAIMIALVTFGPEF
jgi:hypothetical protein